LEDKSGLDFSKPFLINRERAFFLQGREVEAMDCESDMTEGDMRGSVPETTRNLPSPRLENEA
jgi:hypothetical protein